jgi:glycosyltransferase involved in cell wall biosynthesis
MKGLKGSMSRYAKLVEEALSRQALSAMPIEPRPINLSLSLQLPGWLPNSIKIWANHLWILLSAKYRILSCRPDIVHVLDGSYGYMAYRLNNVATIATVHDLIPLLQQQKTFGPDRTSFLSRKLVKMMLRGWRNCSALIAVSGRTRRDMCKSAGITDKAVHVIPNALDRVFLEASCDPEEIETSGFEGNIPIILNVGNNGHYKNREGVLRIFSTIRESRAARLVMAGEPPSRHLLKMTEKLGISNNVEYAVNVDDAALGKLYRNASMLLFPSIYEGFGWPPLEAMACGCPVVCSSEASLPEVVGDAALLAPADDEERLAALCLSVLDEAELAQSLVEKGRVRARQFTSQRMGEQLMEVYERVLSQQANESKLY